MKCTFCWQIGFVFQDAQKLFLLKITTTHNLRLINLWEKKRSCFWLFRFMCWVVSPQEWVQLPSSEAFRCSLTYPSILDRIKMTFPSSWDLITCQLISTVITQTCLFWRLLPEAAVLLLNAFSDSGDDWKKQTTPNLRCVCNLQSCIRFKLNTACWQKTTF